MTTALIVICLCSSLSSSVGAGLFTSGLIPNTAPQLLKKVKAEKIKKVVDPLVGDLQSFKNKSFKSGSQEENQFIGDIDKTKCQNLINVMNETKPLIKTEIDSQPNEVFSLSGVVNKRTVLYDFLETPPEDIESIGRICVKRLEKK
jgi:hypothetical protein